MSAKEKLITSLFDLLTTKNFLDINVSEVCKIAKVHRTTFYAYYDNLVELLVDSKDYALKKFKDEDILKSLKIDSKALISIKSNLLALIYENAQKRDLI